MIVNTAPKTYPDAPEEKIDSLLKQLSREEKLALCRAAGTFINGACERLGIPSLVMSDGPHGVRTELRNDSWAPVEGDFRITYLPTGTAMAATWNPDLARQFGQVLGAESRARGKDIILGPGFNIIRSPLCGRNFEYYSEDPHLIERLAVPCIQGIQAQGVAACAKHFAANNQETDRHETDAIIDERTLREIYLPGFEAAVKEAGVWTVMGAYNRVNGQFCCHHRHLLDEILKGEWGFPGAVISDWGGVRNTAEALANGLDIEMGGPHGAPELYLGAPAMRLLDLGEAREEWVDAKVKRILRVLHWVGSLSAAARPGGARNTPEHQQVARRIASEAFVLLKNEPPKNLAEPLLPIKTDRIRKVAVIGRNADTRHGGKGGSSGVPALYEITPLQGLLEKLEGRVEIVHAQGYPFGPQAGEPIDIQYLDITDSAGIRGWRCDIHDNRPLAGAPVLTRTDATAGVDLTNQAPLPEMNPDEYSMRWKAKLTVPQDGRYEIFLCGTDCSEFLVDGITRLHSWDKEPLSVSQGFTWKKGETHSLELRVIAKHGRAFGQLTWIPPWVQATATTGILAEAVEAARNADVTLFFGGADHSLDTEGADRAEYSLPGGQDALIAALLDATPNLAVFLSGGAAVGLPWASRVPAIMQTWYSGMEGGRALADIILGEANPSGRLPFTWPVDLAQVSAHAAGEYRKGRCEYRDGLLVGYRWADAQGQDPLFPFGHGLSYTSFSLSELKVDGKRPFEASVAVTNTGQRKGATVVQLYVAPIGDEQGRAPRELRAFAKVELEAGETRTLDLKLSPRSYTIWDTAAATAGWRLIPGNYRLEVGFSSRDLSLSADLSVTTQ